MNEEENAESLSAENAPKVVRGKPITKENARQMQLSSAAARKRRKEARIKMLDALTGELDLGVELVKAMKTKDEAYLGMIVTATRLTGLQWEQSDEGREQRLAFKGDVNAKTKTDNTLHVTIEEAVKQ